MMYTRTISSRLVHAREEAARAAGESAPERPETSTSPETRPPLQRRTLARWWVR